MLGISIALLPWLLGGVITFIVFRKEELNLRLLAFSAGTLLGNEFIAGAAIALSYLQVSILKPWFAYSLTALLLLSTMIGLRAVDLSSIRLARLSALQLLLISLTTAVAISALLINLSMPTAGWDSLDYWAPLANDFISAQTDSPARPWLYDGTHPSTVAIISAWWAYWTYELSGLSLPYLGWWFTWVSLIIATASFTHFFSRSLNLSLLSAYITASIPLLENHVLMGGYAELFLVAHLVVSAAMLATGAAIKHRVAVLTGLILCLGCIYIKNIGYLYSGLLLLSVSLITLGSSPRRAVIYVILLSALAFYSLSFFAGQSFEIGNRIITIEDPDLLQIAFNEFYSLMVNASFGLIPEIFLIAIAALFLSNSGRHCFETIPLVAAFFIFIALCGSQSLDYGMRYALPENDTGNSRFSLTFIGLACLSMPFVYNMLFSKKSTLRDV